MIKMSKNNTALSTLKHLFEALNKQNIRYCHWKSNCRRDKAMTGETDLDLLIDKSEAEIFCSTLYIFDIKLMRSNIYGRYPAMEDYLGYDKETGSLFHLHVHYRLILGRKHVKGYHLPLEKVLLDSAIITEQKNVKIPSPEVELIILVLRILFKTDYKQLVRSYIKKCSPIPDTLEKELDFLSAQTTESNIFQLLDQLDHTIPSVIIKEFLKYRKKKCISTWPIFLMQRQIITQLSKFRWISRWEHNKRFVKKKYKNLWPWIKLDRKQMSKGGTTIAFVGADGSGKTSLIKDIIPWLEWKLEVVMFYMGSKKPSNLTRLAKWLFVNANRIHKIFNILVFWNNSLTTKHHSSFVCFFEYLFMIALGKDRKDRYYKGFRAAASGSITIFDRFPLPEVYEQMDGPSRGKKDGHLFRGLREIEKRQYSAIKRPDHIIMLHINPETSISRKPDHDFDMIRAKSKSLEKFFYNNLNITHLDANNPYSIVLSDVKKTIWTLL